MRHRLLVAVLMLWPCWSFAEEPASYDLLEDLVLQHEPAFLDEPAVEASAQTGMTEAGVETTVGASSEPARQLAALQAELSLLTEGLETFRDPESTIRVLKRASQAYVPELGRFLKDRDTTLEALYRVLAMTDYTWAMRFPEPPCEPEMRRESLLRSPDGLFTDPATGRLHPWTAKTLEAGLAGETRQCVLEETSAQAALKPADYESLRSRLRALTGALASTDESGSARAILYCARAELYERLAQVHRKEEGAVPAGRQTVMTSVPPGSAVLMVAVSSGSGYRALGGAVLVRHARGVKALTDTRVVLDPDTGLVRTGLLAFARPPKRGEPPGVPFNLVVERIEHRFNLDIAVARLEGGPDLPALQLAGKEASQGDLVQAVGHGSMTGGWTVSQGLVTASNGRAFRTDATLGPDSAGSAIVNEAGELAGVAVADDAGVHALQAAVLRDFLDGRQVPRINAAEELGPAYNQGTTAILTPAMPFDLQMHPSQGTGLIEAGLGSNLGGVAWDGGGSGTGGFRFRPSTSRSSSWGSSSYRSYDYDPNSPAYQLGQRIGTAIRQGIERFLTWLFTPRPKVNLPAKPVMTVQTPPKPVKPPPPPPPPHKPRIAGLSLIASPQRLAAWGQVSLTAEVSLDQADKPRSGLSVVFEIPKGWDAKFQGSSRMTTDSSGRALVMVDIPKPKGSWNDSDAILFKARVSGSGEVQGSASASAGVQPPPMPLITGLSLTADSDVPAFKAPVSLTAVLSFNDAAEEKGGILVRFTADPERYARFGQASTAGSFEARTDAEGRAEVKVSLIEDERMKERRLTSTVRVRSRDAFAGLDAEANKVAQARDAPSTDEETEDAAEPESLPAALGLPGRPVPLPPRQILRPVEGSSEAAGVLKTVRLTATVIPSDVLLGAPGARLVQFVDFKAGVLRMTSSKKKKRQNRVNVHVQVNPGSVLLGNEACTDCSRANALGLIPVVTTQIGRAASLPGYVYAAEKASTLLGSITTPPPLPPKSYYFGEGNNRGPYRLDVEIWGAYPKLGE